MEITGGFVAGNLSSNMVRKESGSDSFLPAAGAMRVASATGKTGSDRSVSVEEVSTLGQRRHREAKI